MLLKTLFMLKTLEARRKKTFSDAATGALVKDKVVKKLVIFFVLFHSYKGGQTL